MSVKLTVSVVVNNYNYAEFLAAAIDSALTQTYPAVEVVVVDDGSTDASREIIGRYGARVVPVLKDNGGQPSAFNAGFAASRGDIVVFLDSDDMLAPDAVATVVELLAAEDLVNVRWHQWEIDEHGTRTGATIPRMALAEGDLRDFVIANGPAVVANAPTSGNAWTREFLLEVLPVPEGGDKHGADGYLCNLAAASGAMRAASRPLGFYRVHPRSFSPRTSEAFIRRDVRRYPQLAATLAAHLAKRGVEVDAQRWQGPGTAYRWMIAMLEVKDRVQRLVPEGLTIALVDDGLLGPDFLAGRGAAPFVQRDGQYWGAPPDDDSAVAELELARGRGSSFLLFISSTFWWLEHYRGFRAYLETSFDCVYKSDDMILFDLRTTRE